MKKKIKISFSFFLLAGIMLSSILGIAQNESINLTAQKANSSISGRIEKSAILSAHDQKELVAKDLVFENEEDNKEDLLDGASISLRELIVFRFDLSPPSRGHTIVNTVPLNILNCVFLI